MKTFLKSLALAVLLALPAASGFAAGSHTSKTYADTNGNRFVVGSGGKIEILSGGTMVVDSGGSITNNGTSTPGAKTVGTGTATFKDAGLISSQFSATGVGNTADTTDDVLFTYTLPANSLITAGNAIRVDCFGSTAANGNNKTVKLWFGSELITSGVVTDNNKNWNSSLLIGRTAASTQMVRGTMTHDTSGITPYVAAGAETETAGITIKCTGASGTTGAASDVLGKGMTIEFLN